MTHTEAYSRQRFYSAGQLKKTTTTMCSQHLPQEPGWTRAPRLRNGGGSFLPQPPSGQRADHLDPGHKPSTLVTGWREAVHLGCHSGGQVTLAESTSWGGEMACRNSSPASWRETHTHTHTHTSLQDGDFKGAWKGRMSQDAAWRGCVSQGISAPSLCGQAVVLLASSCVPPCRDPTRHSRAPSVIRGLTSCLGDSRTSAALRRVWTTLRMSWQEQRTFSIRKTRSLPLGWPTGCEQFREVSAGLRGRAGRDCH